MAEYQDFQDLDFFKCVGNVYIHTVTIYGLYKACKFAIKMTMRLASNFNKFGHRIINLKTSEENKSFIQAICVRHYISTILDKRDSEGKTLVQDDRFNGHTRNKDLAVTKDRGKVDYNSVGKTRFLAKLQYTLESSDDKFKQHLQTCLTKMDNEYKNKYAFYKDMAQFNMNIAVFITNKRNHPKLHIYKSDTPVNAQWLLLVDENKDDTMDNLGVMTGNTELLASAEEILNSEFTFITREVSHMLNKYKVEVVEGNYDDLKLTYHNELYGKKELPVDDLTSADDLIHSINQKTRRARRIVRILKHDEASVTRTRTYTKRKNAADGKKKENDGIDMVKRTQPQPPALQKRPQKFPDNPNDLSDPLVQQRHSDVIKATRDEEKKTATLRLLDLTSRTVGSGRVGEP